MKVYVVIDPMLDDENYNGEIVGVFSDENKVKELVEKRENWYKEYKDAKAICQNCMFYDMLIDERWNLDLPECYTAAFVCGGYFGLPKRTCCKGNFYRDGIESLIIKEFELDEQELEIFDVKGKE